MGTERKPPTPPGVRKPDSASHTPAIPSNGSSQNGNDALFRELMENASDMIFVQDLGGNFTWVNKAVTALTGYTPEEAGKMRMQDIVAREHWAIAEEQSRRKFLGEQSTTTYEVDLVAKNGRRIAVEVSTRLIQDHGRVVGVQGTVRDLTGRRHTERALQSSEQKLLLHLRQTLLGVIEWNTSFEVVDWNEGAEKIFGYSRGEALGRHGSFIVPRQAKEHVDQVWSNLLSQQGGTRSTNENVRKDGRIILSEWFNTPLVDSQGRVMAVASLVQDVTERKSAEEALRVSEERYRLLFERNLAGVYWTSLDGDFVDCNESFARIFGYDSRFEVLGKSSSDLYATSAERSELLRRLREHKTLTNLEWQGRRKDGTPIWLLENVSLVHHEELPLIQGTLVEITERKLAEQAMQQAEKKYRSIFENAAEGIFQTSLDGRWLTVNPPLAAIFGYNSPQQLMQNIDLNRNFYVQPGRRQEFIRLASKGDVRGFESQVYRSDGKIIWILESGRAVRDERGNLIGLEGTLQDITERKEAESALQASRRFIERIADSSPNILYLYDLREKRLVYTNSQLATILGYNPEHAQHMGDGFLEAMMHPEDAALMAARGNPFPEAKDGEILESEYRVRHAKGEWRWLHSRDTVFTRDGNGEPVQVLGAAEDVTERKLAEAALRSSERRLRRQNEALVELAQRKVVERGDLEAALQQITEASARTLEVRRVRVWFYTDDRSVLRCVDDYDRTTGQHTGQLHMPVKDFPKYFEALGRERTIAAHEALADPRTHELVPAYLRPRGITSRLDATIRVGGRVIGVLSHEHTGPARQWALDEENFAGSMADLVSLAIEASERKRAEIALRESESKFRAVAETAASAIYIHQGERFLYCNRATELISGYTRQELFQLNPFAMVHPADREFVTERFRQRQTGVQSSPRYEYRIITKTGETRWLDFSGTPVQ
ncbi:MAG: PAS domain S-box protein, partial [Acidobacteriales bacterium]|nr:PAS domain S-box protein [Terriglobales bacterium]